MTDLHWAVFALRDIQSALDDQRYDIASHHINDAIAAIIAIDAEDCSPTVGSSNEHRAASSH